MTQAGRRAVLFRNDQSLGHHWLRLKLRGRGANPEAIGARIELVANGETQKRQVMPTRSYQSQSELTVTFGLGSYDSVDNLTITWPDGAVQQVGSLAVDQLHVVEQTVP